MDTMTSRLGAGAPPTKVNEISHSIGMSFRTLRVRACCLGMLVAVVAALDDAPETVAVGGDPPGLAEEFPARGCCLAREAVHAAVQVV